MDRRDFMKLVGGAGAATWLTACTKVAGRLGDSHKAKKPNILVICSDEHHPLKIGYRRHPHVKTPNLDKIARQGATFTNAYCNSPLCGPSRMSFMTGKYVHQIGVWNNCVPLDPAEMTWARRFDQAGIESILLGKIDSAGKYQDVGFTQWRSNNRRPALDPWTMKSPYGPKLKDWVWQPFSQVQSAGTREDGLKQLLKSGGISSTVGLQDSRHYSHTGFYDHDREVTNWAMDYIRTKAGQQIEDPWVLYVGYVMPHWPFRCPKKYFDMYYSDKLELPHDAHFPNSKLHPALQHFQTTCGYPEITEDMLRKAIAAYYGMITCMDEMIGELVHELKRQGFYDNTYIIYTSDHGEGLGEHGLFHKSTSYEASAGVPLVMRGPRIPAGKQITRPVSLIDLYPTLLDIMEMQAEPDRPGKSWLPLVRGQQPDRPDYVFSEFHGELFPDSWYMLRRGDYKYTYYVKDRPTLFNIKKDPYEDKNLAGDSKHAGLVREFEKLLHSIVDPEQVCLKSKHDFGLIGPDGEDYTETLTVQQLEQGISEGRFPAASKITFDR